MQLATSLLVLGMLSMILNTTSALETYGPEYVFNNGTMSPGLSCTSSEWELIKTTFGNAASGNRRLGASYRKLDACSDCLRSASLSACLAAGVGCKPRRRRLAGEESVRNGQQGRKLTQCDAAITSIYNALAALTVSQSCRSFLDAPRSVTCELFTTDCYINKVSLWNALTEGIIHETFNATGGTVCRNQKVTFRAHTNFGVGNINFLAYGPGGYVSNRSETTDPYYMHGNAGTNVYGTYFPKGDYNLTISTQFNSAKRVIRFASIDCP